MESKSTKEICWKNGRIIPVEDANISIKTHSLHYGSAVFEGIRAYKTQNGTAILMLEDHIKRLFYSMEAMSMKINYTCQELCKACIETVKASGLESCYIRPIVYYGQGGIGVLPK